MGTRIHNGFQFNTTDFGKVDAVIRRMRTELRPMHLAALSKVYAELAVTSIDYQATRSLRPGGEGEISIRETASSEWLKLVGSARDFADRFGVPAAEEIAGRAAAALSMLTPFDPATMAPAVPSAAALAFVGEAASMDPGVIPALKASHERPMSAAWSQVSDRQWQIERTRRRDPAVDFEFSVDIVAHEGRYYGIFRTEQSDWRKLWLAQPEVSEFAYWTDEPPEGTTDEEWDARGKLWDEIMPSGVPAHSCWSANLLDPWLRIAPEDIHAVLSALPSYETRVSRIARTLVLNAQSAASGLFRPGMETHEYMSIYRKSNEWMKTDEGLEAVAAMRVEVARLLKADLTETDLREGVPDPTPDFETSASSPAPR